MEAAQKLGNLPLMECGSEILKSQFLFDPSYRNLNHGSFGTFPRFVRDAFRKSQDDCEARPDRYIRYDYPKALDQSREAVAQVVNAPVGTCVFVPNATTGVNTVLRGLVYSPGDVIIYFATIYGACEKSVTYITETTPAESRKIEYTYPISDDALCDAFSKTVTEIKAAGKTPKLAIFDTIVSLPGVRAPFERLTSLCREHDVLSLIDGAHCVGHIPIDLPSLDPDFFVSNCHKWLFVPRGCAVFYVPLRNQHLIRSTLPTSHGFTPLPTDGPVIINNPLPPSAKSAFVVNFEFVGTVDNAPYTSLPAAVEFRKSITWRGKSGEEAITAYTQSQAREGGKLLAEALGTEVLENPEGTLGNCNFSNVRLPLDFAALTGGGDRGKAVKIAAWFAQVMVAEYDTFIAVIVYDGAWWVRFSAQVYLTLEDWRWAGGVLKEVCGRIEKGEAL